MTPQDEQHLDLLAIFHYVVGGLLALCSCIFIVYIAIGILMLCAKPVEGKENIPKLFAIFVIVIPAIFMLGGWTLSGCIVAAGRKLKKRTAWTFCMIVAGAECLFMPLGTILGICTILLLMKEPVRQRFGRVDAGNPPQ